MFSKVYVSRFACHSLDGVAVYPFFPVDCTDCTLPVALEM